MASALGQELLDRLLMRSLEDKVGKRAPETQASIAALVRAAELRLGVADSQTDERAIAVTLDLYRDAATWLAAALLEDEGKTVDLSLGRAAVWSAFDKQVTGLERARAFFSSSDPFGADAMARDEQAELREHARAACAELRAAIEPRSKSELATARRARVIAFAVGAAVLVGYLIRTITHPTNLALGAAVSMSSQYPGTPSPQGVVNGEVEGKYAAHTSIQESPWIMVDLGDARAIKEIRVFNRGDEFASETAPLVLEVSTDGLSFEPLERRDQTFSQSDPWVVKTASSARYVRVTKPGRGFIALSEIEIY